MTAGDSNQAQVPRCGRSHLGHRSPLSGRSHQNRDLEFGEKATALKQPDPTFLKLA